MTALFFLIPACLFCFYQCYKHLSYEPPVEWIGAEIRAPLLQRGTLVANLRHQNSPYLEEAVCHWAIRLQSPTLPLDDALKSELTKCGIIARVVSVALEGTDLPPEKHKKLSTADSLVSTFKAKDEASRALADAAGIDLRDIEGASFKVHKERYAKRKISEIFYDDDKA